MFKRVLIFVLIGFSLHAAAFDKFLEIAQTVLTAYNTASKSSECYQIQPINYQTAHYSADNPSLAFLDGSAYNFVVQNGYDPTEWADAWIWMQSEINDSLKAVSAMDMRLKENIYDYIIAQQPILDDSAYCCACAFQGWNRRSWHDLNYYREIISVSELKSLEGILAKATVIRYLLEQLYDHHREDYEDLIEALDEFNEGVVTIQAARAIAMMVRTKGASIGAYVAQIALLAGIELFTESVLKYGDEKLSSYAANGNCRRYTSYLKTCNYFVRFLSEHGLTAKIRTKFKLPFQDTLHKRAPRAKLQQSVTGKQSARVDYASTKQSRHDDLQRQQMVQRTSTVTQQVQKKAGPQKKAVVGSSSKQKQQAVVSTTQQRVTKSATTAKKLTPAKTVGQTKNPVGSQRQSGGVARDRVVGPELGKQGVVEPVRSSGASKLQPEKKRAATIEAQRKIGNVGTHRELTSNVGGKGFYDNKQAHHIPAKTVITKHGINEKDGLAIMMTNEQHAKTRTYRGKARCIPANATPRSELAKDLRDVRRIMKEDRTYSKEVNRNLINGVKDFKGKNPDVFKKGQK